MKQRVVFAFGPWKLDPVAKVLFRNGEPVHMTRKAVETLLTLVQNPGQVLTKEEIMSAVWTDRVVDEANLAQNIAVVRRILAAEKGSPAHIETFPGRGYRLEGPVAVEHELESPAPPPPPVAPAPVAPPSESGPAVFPALASSPSVHGRKWVIGLLLVLTGISLAVYRSMSSSASSRPEAETVARVTPVTRMAGKEYQTAITRDGKRIAFLWAEDASTPPQVWVQDIAGGSARALSAGGNHSSPAWSADGSQIVYLRIQRTSTEVVLASSKDASERVVARFDTSAYGYDHRRMDWSPDGRTLVISRPVPGRSTLALYLVDASTGQSHAITHPGDVTTGDVDPRFSPDGSQISFVRLVHRTAQEIFTVASSGGEAVQVTKLGRRISSHDWMRDGRSIVFASDRDGNFRLWRLRLPSRDGGQSAKPLAVYSEFPIQLAAARNADSLAYSALQQDRNIWRINIQSLEWKRLIASSGQDASPQFSPHGDRICFRSDRSGEDQLWVSKADGSQATQITQGAMRPSVGRWSPDGTSIVFNSPETGKVWIAQQAGSNWTVKNTGVQGVHPVFSSDGRWIYAGGPSGINRFPASGWPVETVSSSRSEALAVSQDGRYLYFARDPADVALWRVDLDSKATEKVLYGLVPGCTSCWALDADGVYYLGSDAGSFDRQVLNFWSFKSATARTVLPYPEPLWPLGSGPFSLGPGGNLLVVRVEPSESDAMLVTPFR